MLFGGNYIVQQYVKLSEVQTPVQTINKYTNNYIKDIAVGFEGEHISREMEVFR